MVEQKTPAAPKSAPVSFSHDNTMILRPVITEKSTASRELMGKYTFEVAEKSTKVGVRRAVERLFGVKVRKVNLVRRHGKMRRVRQSPGWTKDTKRAVVTIEPGQKIAFFEGI